MQFRIQSAGRLFGPLFLLWSGMTAATDYTVNSAADNIDADGNITLREAVMAASTDAAVGDAPAGSADGDTISFDPLTFALAQVITLDGSLGPLVISDDVTIDGTVAPMVPDITIAGDTQARLFTVDAANPAGSTVLATLANLTLTGGQATDGGAILVMAGAELDLNTVSLSGAVATGALPENGGGAIFNAGSLILVATTISGNSATGAEARGGGIFNTGTLTATDSTISSNSAMGAGGGIESADGSSLTLSNTTVDGNDAGPMPGNGGGIHLAGAVTAVLDGGSVVTANTATGNGGGVWVGGGTLQLDGASVGNNIASAPSASDGGGGLYILAGDVQISGGSVSGNQALGADARGGGIFNGDGASLSIEGGTSFDGNSAQSAGGAIEDASGAATTTTIIASFSNNTALGVPGNGGALHIAGDGISQIGTSSFSGNQAAGEGGAIWNGSGRMTIDGRQGAVTIDGNTASGAAADDGGGGMFNNGGAVVILGPVSFTNNVADGAEGSGGGILSVGGSVQGTNVTVSSNTANRAGGGIEMAGAFALNLTDATMEMNNAGVAPAVGSPGSGGGIHTSGVGTVTLIQPDLLLNTAAAQGGGIWVGANNTLSITAGFIDSNDAAGELETDGGGGIYSQGANVSITGAFVVDNTAINGAASGGGIFNNGGTLEVSRALIARNAAARAGGGIEDRSIDAATVVTISRTFINENTAGANPGNGGGLHVTGASSDVSLDRSVVASNVAANEGGGLWNAADSSLDLVNTTVSGNDGGATAGGGILNNGFLTLANVTVASNTTAGTGGGLFIDAAASAILSNTILADNSADTADPDVSGSLESTNGLIEDPGSSSPIGNGNQLGVDPLLGPLEDNGGATLTHALMAGSPAVDAGLGCTGAGVGGLDQRGLQRDADCDIGAYELSPVAVVTSGNVRFDTAVTVAPGETNVLAAGFGVSNTANDPIEFRSFRGRIEGNPALVGAARVLTEDSEGNAVELSNGGGAEISFEGSAFTVSFDPPRELAVDADDIFLVEIDIAEAEMMEARAYLALAGLGIWSLLLVPAGALSRRTRLLLAAVIATLALAGCIRSGGGDSGGGGGGGGGGTPPPDTGERTMQFSIEQVEAIRPAGGDQVIGFETPFEGAEITVDP